MDSNIIALRVKFPLHFKDSAQFLLGVNPVFGRPASGALLTLCFSRWDEVPPQKVVKAQVG